MQKEPQTMLRLFSERPFVLGYLSAPVKDLILTVADSVYRGTHRLVIAELLFHELSDGFVCLLVLDGTLGKLTLCNVLIGDLSRTLCSRDHKLITVEIALCRKLIN